MRFKNFNFYELVTPYTYFMYMKRGGVKAIIKEGIIIETWVSDKCWYEFNINFLKDIQKLRTYLRKPFTVNTWHKNENILNLIANGYKEDLFEISIKGSSDNSVFINRGKRLLEVEMGADLSAHIGGIALDFVVNFMSAKSVRKYLIENQKRFPYIKRLEDNVNWVHADAFDTRKKQIELF